VELYQGGDLALLSTGPEFLRAIQTNAPKVAARTAPYPPITGAGGQTNVAVMNLSIPRQSRMAPEALSLALFLTDADNQARFAAQARVLPSSRGALTSIASQLAQERPRDSQERLVREARSLSIRSLSGAQVLVPASPGVKRLQAIVYTQLQRAMLGQASSDEALAIAERDWNRYAEARWP
jgi:putative chitobiose transport system substrate-binding protein